MKIYNLFITTLSIASFFSTTVLSKPIFFCLENHSFVKLVSKNFHDDKSSCHSDIKDKMIKKFCAECDCYITQVLSNISFENLIITISKNNFDVFFASYYSISCKVKDPPPKNYFL